VAVYKDHLFAARCRLERLRGCYSPIIPEDLGRIHSARRARSWAGIAGLAGFCALILDILAGLQHASLILILTWPAMGIGYISGLRLARCLLRWTVRRMMTPGEDVFVDLARLDSGGPVRVVLEKIHRAERASTAYPMAAFSLLAPLTIHLVAGLAFFRVELHEFDKWIVWSYALVGHAHLTLLCLSIAYVLRLRRELDQDQPTSGGGAGVRALLWTTLAGAIPGVVLFCIPPVLVFVTGIIFVPWMYSWAARRLKQERQCLRDHGLDLDTPRPLHR
jgi:hypothetical protein